MKEILTRCCKNCGSQKFKTWDNLTDEEKFLIQRLPQNTETSIEQKKKQHFCKRCFYGFAEIQNET